MSNENAADDWLRLNRDNWDERVPIHVASNFYDVPGFRAGKDALRDYEIDEVGDVSGKRLLHLQCHIGLDTLSWARRGAIVTGLDFSAKAIEYARDLAVGIGEPDARFVTSDVYAAEDALPGEEFDIVYTGIGALVWLPDVPRWARVVAALLADGGTFYINEFHPVTDMLDDETGRTVAHDYFRTEPHVFEAPFTYTDSDRQLQNALEVEWSHPLGEVVTALAAAGLRIEFLHERDATMFPRYQALQRDDGGWFRFPEGYPRIPMMYSIRATKS